MNGLGDNDKQSDIKNFELHDNDRLKCVHDLPINDNNNNGNMKHNKMKTRSYISEICKLTTNGTTNVVKSPPDIVVVELITTTTTTNNNNNNEKTSDNTNRCLLPKKRKINDLIDQKVEINNEKRFISNICGLNKKQKAKNYRLNRENKLIRNILLNKSLPTEAANELNNNNNNNNNNNDQSSKLADLLQKPLVEHKELTTVIENTCHSNDNNNKLENDNSSCINEIKNTANDDNSYEHKHKTTSESLNQTNLNDGLNAVRNERKSCVCYNVNERRSASLKTGSNKSQSSDNNNKTSKLSRILEHDIENKSLLRVNQNSIVNPIKANPKKQNEHIPHVPKENHQNIPTTNKKRTRTRKIKDILENKNIFTNQIVKENNKNNELLIVVSKNEKLTNEKTSKTSENLDDNRDAFLCKKCVCGAADHQRITSLRCPLNSNRPKEATTTLTTPTTYRKSRKIRAILLNENNVNSNNSSGVVVGDHDHTDHNSNDSNINNSNSTTNDNNNNSNNELNSSLNVQSECLTKQEKGRSSDNEDNNNNNKLKAIPKKLCQKSNRSKKIRDISLTILNRNTDTQSNTTNSSMSNNSLINNNLNNNVNNHQTKIE